MAMESRFQVGDSVLAKCVFSGQFREAFISRVEPYRGREGYYIRWKSPLGGGNWEQWHSSGGWVQGVNVRSVDRDCACITNNGLLAERARGCALEHSGEIVTLDDQFGEGFDPWADGPIPDDNRLKRASKW